MTTVSTCDILWDMDKLLTLKEVAERLRVGRSTLYRWVREGRLKPHRLPGGRMRFYEEDVERLLQIEHPDQEVQEASGSL